MKITQIRDKEHSEALTVLEMNVFLQKTKTEIQARPVSALRQTLQYYLPGESCELARKLPKIIPAAVFGRVNGIKHMPIVRHHYWWARRARINPPSVGI